MFYGKSICNQASHFSGGLAFCKTLNRTFVVPPWVEYRKAETRSKQVRLDSYFSLDPIKEHHRIILITDFMSEVTYKLSLKKNAFNFVR
uniref:GDP-fucose protein O-fucosyltransferase 1 n=1 Tax=Glossina palpalis gambiensis TaxID=67801 RepID=A0A1B0BA62_9MUSC